MRSPHCLLNGKSNSAFKKLKKKFDPYRTKEHAGKRIATKKVSKATLNTFILLFVNIFRY